MANKKYALGRSQQVIVSARHDERLPFDADKLPCFFWNLEVPVPETTARLQEHLRIYGALPPLVRASRLA